MAKIKDYPLLPEFSGEEVFIVETDDGTRSISYEQLVNLILEQHEKINDENLSDEVTEILENNEILKTVANKKMDNLRFAAGSLNYLSAITAGIYAISIVDEDGSVADNATAKISVNNNSSDFITLQNHSVLFLIKDESNIISYILNENGL